MRTPVISMLGISFMLCVCGELWAYPKSHGPFHEGEEPNVFSIHRCDLLAPEDVNTWMTSGIGLFGRTDNQSMPQVYLMNSPAVSRGTVVKILNQTKEVVFGPQQISENCTAPGVYFSELNGDEKEDFIVWVSSGGCGLGAGYCDIAFILSEGSGYKSTVIRTLFPELEDFVDFTGDGTCEFILTSFVYGEQGRDGKTHNYWVYNILEIKGTEIVINNEIDERFPKWIWYTFKPNHKPTTQLTSEQKQRLWKPYSERIFYRPKFDKSKKKKNPKTSTIQ